jgi:hypothetical protein
MSMFTATAKKAVTEGFFLMVAGKKGDVVEGYYRSQHSRDGGTTTERTTGRISWGEKRTDTNSIYGMRNI